MHHPTLANKLAFPPGFAKKMQTFSALLCHTQQRGYSRTLRVCAVQAAMKLTDVEGAIKVAINLLKRAFSCASSLDLPHNRLYKASL